jgi:hypothetical protein
MVDLFAAGGVPANVTTATTAEFRVGGAANISCTISAGNSSCTSSGSGPAVAAGSLVSFGITSGTFPAGNFFRFGMKCQ